MRLITFSLLLALVLMTNSCGLVSGTAATYNTNKDNIVFMFGYLNGSLEGSPAYLKKAALSAFKDNAIKESHSSSNDKGAVVKGITGEESNVSVYITKTKNGYCDIQINVGLLGNEEMSKNIFYAMQNYGAFAPKAK